MGPALNGSSAIRRFERSDAIEIRDGITFNFYTGLPHVYVNYLLSHSIFTAFTNSEVLSSTASNQIELDLREPRHWLLF